ncbi:MAG: hypothetical protein PHY48_14990 [Candidatus Cloacimonetes bacterium]|nr:hypothetical protein [Candidatus Cloacimonadota bacterium]
MNKRKHAAIIVLVIIFIGVIVFIIRPRQRAKADSQLVGQTNNPSVFNVMRDSDYKQVEAIAASVALYLTQEQQDAREHKWGKPNLPAVDKARQSGAEAKVTLRVIDSRGAPVPEAEIQMAFFPQDSYEAAKISKGLTDKDGLFVVSGKTVDDISFSTSKTNYYVTSRKFHFYRRGTECIKNGRWQPWNPTLEVVLKEKRKPIPMYTKQVEVKMPIRNVPIGYDLLKGDWVSPHGQGKNADITLTYSESPRTCYEPN